MFSSMTKSSLKCSADVKADNIFRTKNSAVSCHNRELEDFVSHQSRILSVAKLERRKSYAHQRETTGFSSDCLQLHSFSKWELLEIFYQSSLIVDC